MDPDSTDHFGDTASEFRATTCIKEPSVYRAIALRDSIAADATYFEEHWCTPDFGSIAKTLVKNLSLSHQMERAMARMSSSMLDLIYRVSQKNSRDKRLCPPTVLSKVSLPLSHRRFMDASLTPMALSVCLD